MASKGDLLFLLGFLIFLGWIALGWAYSGWLTYTGLFMVSISMMIVGLVMRWGGADLFTVRKKRLDFLVLVVFLFAISLVVSLSNDSYGYAFIGTTSYVANTPMTLQIDGAPKITLHRSVFLQTIGPFSAQKDIYMSVTFSNPSVSNWTSYYCCLAIVAGYGLSSVPNVFTDHPVSFNMTRLPNGDYQASGHFYVQTNGPLWVGVVPIPFNGTRDATALRTQTMPVMNISSAQDSLSVQTTEITARVGFIFGSFSILAAAPILENIFEDRLRPN